ncbi:MAG: carbohydrate binding family 9 domain-containing protein [Gemmatimonadaceae bacterium]|nr:carbohydrate binding family 9 domain-containing protein [Gemmatimonadaceae bacterium]
MPHVLIRILAAALLAAPAATAAAQGPAGTGTRPPDSPPELRAARAGERMRIDGLLDEAAWAGAPVAAGFIQSEPLSGRPASQATEVRVLYDRDYLYIGAFMHDSQPSMAVVNDIRKDFTEEDQDDFEVMLDTFGDRRNGYVFSTNIEGARHDRQVALEGREVNKSWDAVWLVKTQRRADGWTVEMRIPFRALRFSRSAGSAWGINFSRHIRRVNEVSFWAPVPRAFGLNRVSLAGSLVGLETGSAGRDLRVKPYISENAVRALGTTAAPAPSMSNSIEVGADVKAALTPGLTMDLTVNPDFGQVEADEQQVNLTQFSQFFPEKRDFFLENSGVFYVGDAARKSGGTTIVTPDEDNLLFFSRRIGLTAGGAPIPILGGMRVTGKLAERTRIGILSVQDRAMGTDPASNASVIRLRQNLGRAGNDLGVFVLQNVHTSGPSYTNRVIGVDKNLRLFGNLDWNSYAARTSTPGKTSGDYAWRSTVNWEGVFFHFKSGLMELGPGFQNDLGYYRRVGMRKYILETGLRPRSAGLRAHGIRELHPHIGWAYQEDMGGFELAKSLHSGMSVFFNNGAIFEYSANPIYNRLTAPFRPNAKMASPIPVGGYDWNEHWLLYTSDLSRRFSLDTKYVWGGLYDGTQQTVSAAVQYRPSYRFKAKVGVQRTAATLNTPNLRFVNTLGTFRTSYSFNTNMFVDALSQYDAVSKQFNANIRFNLIHHPLSDLFIVYNDQRILTPDAPVAGRGIIVKFTQMMSF